MNAKTFIVVVETLYSSLKGLGHAILGNFREFQHGLNSHRIN